MTIAILHRDRKGALVLCPTCGHGDLGARGWWDRALDALGRPHVCAYALGDEISPLRNESCGCADPVHARGAVRQAGKR